MKKGTSLILTTVIISAIVVSALVLLLTLKGGTTNTNQQSTPATEQTSQIQNSSDLETAAADLDATNVDSVDGDLNQINQDASTF